MAPEERRQIAVDARNVMKSVRKAVSRIKRDAKKHHIDTMAQDIIEMLTRRAMKAAADNPVPAQDVIDHITFDLAEAQRAASGEKSMQTLTLDEAEQARPRPSKSWPIRRSWFRSPRKGEMRCSLSSNPRAVRQKT